MANTLTFVGRTLTDANIFGGINYSSDINPGDEFSIGNIACACVSFATDVRLPLYSNDPGHGYFTWTEDDTVRGRFYIADSVMEDDLYVVTAYDGVMRLDEPASSLPTIFGLPMQDIAEDIASFIDCYVVGTLKNGSLTGIINSDTSLREVLEYIAEASGCSMKISGVGELTLMYYEDSGTTLAPSDYVKLAPSDYTCAAISKVIIYNEYGEVQASAGTGSNVLYIEQNPFLFNASNTHAAEILSSVSSLTYKPVKVELFDESGLEIGTRATIGTISTLIMRVESSEDGATASSVGVIRRAQRARDAMSIASEALAKADEAPRATEVDTDIGNATVYRYGNMRMVYVNGVSGQTVGQLKTEDRPPVVCRVAGTVYNGSSYVTAILGIDTSGNVTIQGQYGGAISGIQIDFMAPKFITYMV